MTRPPKLARAHRAFLFWRAAVVEASIRLLELELDHDEGHIAHAVFLYRSIALQLLRARWQRHEDRWRRIRDALRTQVEALTAFSSIDLGPEPMEGIVFPTAVRVLRRLHSADTSGTSEVPDGNFARSAVEGEGRSEGRRS